MDLDAIIDQLEEVAGRLGIQIHYERLKQDEDLVRIVEGLLPRLESQGGLP